MYSNYHLIIKKRTKSQAGQLCVWLLDLIINYIICLICNMDSLTGIYVTVFSYLYLLSR